MQAPSVYAAQNKLGIAGLRRTRTRTMRIAGIAQKVGRVRSDRETYGPVGGIDDRGPFEEDAELKGV